MKNERKTICVDFDGTICKNEFPDIGEPIEDTIDYLRRLPEDEYVIVIHTCRANPDFHFYNGRDVFSEMKEWLINNNIPFDSIWCGQGKPYAVAYIDDRSYNPVRTVAQMAEIMNG